MTYDKHSMSAKQFVMISVSSPYKILKSDKHLSSGQNIAIWLVLYLLTFPLMLTANALLLSLFSTVTSNPYLGLGLVSSIFSMLFYILYIPFFILNSYIIYKFSDKAKPFEKIFSDNSSMLIFPFLLYSVGAMMTAYIIGILSLIGLLIMWGAIITYIVRSVSQLKHCQEAAGTQPDTQIYAVISIALMLAPSIIVLILSPETLTIYYKPVIDVFFGGI
ncbi:hypothetical protein [Lacicoccus qingdaonensis]|uniref:Yip1 domain-containing protein n=1 Tax=Lacicoccus qingdaonensis TaxID=576118 RepID=A0A1G9HD31_9BACL|nr:hypothetical protein [Salinicoccus qingdaonensis]SDL10624.1 hypothetical protein SAMN05216216_12222 [Salinicoccus qingdaonensis]